MSAYSAYPVELRGNYEERPNRFLWLIKWFLIIPHYLLLWLISLPIIITVPVSWLLVVVLGRFPLLLWNYHAGLQRWNWRVNFYAYGVGNTDRYPPFSL